jgi:hypothetical protein
VPVESYAALQQVRERVKAAICIGERLHTRWEFAPILEKRLADYIVPDVTRAGAQVIVPLNYRGRMTVAAAADTAAQTGQGPPDPVTPR